MTLAETHPDTLAALLAERLAFERLGLRLHGAAIAKAEHAPTLAGELLPLLAGRLAEEGEHVRWLEERLRELGRDPAAALETARVDGLYDFGLAPRRFECPQLGTNRRKH